MLAANATALFYDKVTLGKLTYTKLWTVTNFVGKILYIYKVTQFFLKKTFRHHAQASKRYFLFVTTQDATGKPYPVRISFQLQRWTQLDVHTTTPFVFYFTFFNNNGLFCPQRDVQTWNLYIYLYL